MLLNSVFLCDLVQDIARVILGQCFLLRITTADVTPGEWIAFVVGIRAGEFTRPRSDTVPGTGWKDFLARDTAERATLSGGGDSKPMPPPDSGE